jgi:methanol--5-hydroxybenzimidazolylcobamide Co-methyltransferase
MRKQFSTLSLEADQLMFGRSRFPLERHGVTIGNGAVLPEIKFTLPPMEVEESNVDEVGVIYTEIIRGVCQRAIELRQKAIVVEFELLPPMTMAPRQGEAVTRILRTELDAYRAKHGLLSLLRVTPVDIREMEKPPKRREGSEHDLLMDSFQRCAEAGADLLSIESTGGKEVTDPSIMAADLRGIIFGTVILGSADMEYLWSRIVDIAGRTNTIPAGDTACGIGNTAMILADQGYIPKVFAAVVRAVTAARSLVAYEVGAQGPGKDCGYENAILKSITGLPMSLEGKSAACAHFSSLGNIAGAYADLWSNESVQHIKLLSGMAPVVSLEQLVYDCRLFNTASGKGKTLEFRDWLVESDAALDPQAYIFRPEVVEELARAIVSASSDYARGVRVAERAVSLLDAAATHGSVELSGREREWLDRMKSTLDGLPAEQQQFIEEEKDRWREYVDYTQYETEEVPSS